MHGCLKMQHGKFTKMRRKITPGTRKSRKIKLHVYQKMRDYMSSALTNAIVKRESITLFPWTCASISSVSSSNVSIVDPRFSILNSRSPTPDSRISIFDSRISIFDLRSVILDPWFPKVLGWSFESKLSSTYLWADYRIPERNKLHLG